jgi:hypothetical protein
MTQQHKRSNKTNGEGYNDPTAFAGIATIEGEGEIVSTIINEINGLLHDYGFEKVGRIVIRNRRNGRIWK